MFQNVGGDNFDAPDYPRTRAGLTQYYNDISFDDVKGSSVFQDGFLGRATNGSYGGIGSDNYDYKIGQRGEEISDPRKNYKTIANGTLNAEGTRVIYEPKDPLGTTERIFFKARPIIGENLPSPVAAVQAETGFSESKAQGILDEAEAKNLSAAKIVVASKALKALGILGSVVGLGFAIVEAEQLIRQGETKAAEALLIEKIGGALGGYVVGAIAAGAVASATGVGAIPGVIIIGVASLVGSIAGSVAGEKAAKEIIEELQSRQENGETVVLQDILDLVEGIKKSNDINDDVLIKENGDSIIFEELKDISPYRIKAGFERPDERIERVIIEVPENSIGSSLATQSAVFTGELGDQAPIPVPGEFDSAFYGDIGTALGRLLANGGDPAAGTWGDDNNEVVADFFGSDYSAQAHPDPNSNPAGFLSSLLVAELLEGISDAIGLDPDGNPIEQYFHERLGTVLDNLVYDTVETVINKTFNQFNFGLPEANPLGLQNGRELVSHVVDIETEAAALLSATGSYVGGAIGTALGKSVGTAFGTASGLQVGTKIGLNFGPVGAIIGAFVGGVVGALFGNLLGRRKPKIPSASATTLLSFQDGMYVLGSVTSQNNGNEDFVSDMARFAADSLNGAIDVIKGNGLNGHIVNSYSPTQTYGHTSSQVYVKIGSQTHNVDSGIEALNIGTVYALKNTQIAGGNLYMKRAVNNSITDNLVSMGNDLQTANDYATYQRNKDIIDAAIAAPYNSLSDGVNGDKAWYNDNEAVLRNIQRSGHQPLSAADQTWWDNNADRVESVLTTLNTVSTFAAGWIITLQRAAELGLNKSAASDLYGGAKGFVDSLQGVINAPLDYENVAFSLDGNDLKVFRDSNADGVVDAGETIVFNERDFISRGATGVGYRDASKTRYGGMSGQELNNWLRSSDYIYSTDWIEYYYDSETVYLNDWSLVGDPYGSTTSPPSRLTSQNNDVQFLDGTGSADIDDAATLYYSLSFRYRDNSGDYPSSNYTSATDIFEIEQPGGGDDIFVGDSRANKLYGRTGDDWLDGGAGNDELYGGAGNDVLIGRGGNDQLNGEDGDDVIIGGTGTDSLRGGLGDDILVKGAGWASAFGQTGDDLIIMTQSDGFNGVVRGGTGTENTGNDTVSFERYSEGITLDMAYRPTEWDESSHFFYGHADTRSYVVRQNDENNALIDYFFVGQIDNVTGTSFGDVLTGDAAGNILRGGGGDDDLYGVTGADTLEGGAGADILRSSHGTPGVFGRTTVSYEHSTGGVDVAITYTTEGSAAAGVLGLQHAFGGDASGDRFVGFMNHLKGSNYSDVLEGNHLNNSLHGLDGDDYFIVTRGNDTYQGGAGFDTVDYGNHQGTSGLTIQAIDGLKTYGYENGYHSAAGHSRSFDVEHIVGTEHGDTIVTGDGDNVLEGGRGNDLLYGGAGNDIYFVELGGGTDTIHELRNLAIPIFGPTINLPQNDGGHDTIMVGYEDGLSWDDIVIGGGIDLTISVPGQVLARAVNSPNQNRELVGVDAIDIGGVGAVDIWYLTGGAIAGYGGTNGNNIIRGDGGNSGYSLLQGFNGDDIIYTSVDSNGNPGAHQEDNFLHGGRGDDTIYASGGDDQYIFDRGSGRDTVTDTGGLDHIQFGPGVAASDLVFTVVGNDLYIGIRPQDDDGSVQLSAQNMDDYIRIRDGGKATGSAGALNHNAHLLEYLTVENTNIDVRTLDINWTVTDSGSSGTGGNNTHLPPLMFDLDGDGLELVSINGSRVVVRGEDDSLTRVGWLSGDDGFLALDRNGNGNIDNLSEISFAQDLEGAVTDLEGLRAYDSNDDGVFNASDARFGEFRIWQDKNQNGRGGRAELMTLGEAGIAEINLTGQSTGKDPNNHADSVVVNTTEYTRTDGTTATAYDVMLAASAIRDGRETNVNMSVSDIVMSGRLGRVSTRRLERLIAQSEAIEANMLSTVVAPIVLDMDGNGELALTDFTQSGVSIDVDNNGYADRIGWVGAQDGLLGLDRNGDGLITAVSEISFLEDVEGAITDLEGLAAFDSNANGLLDAGDGRWGDFRIWQDANQDGVSQIQELVTLDTADLVSVNLTAHTGQENYGGDVENSIFGLTAINWADGRETVAGDVGLRVEYAGLTTADGTQQAVYLTGYAGMEHISAQAMIDFTQLATQSAWGRLAGHRSPLLAKYYVAETEAARLDAMGIDSGFTQEELLAQFEADASEDDVTENTEQTDAQISPDDLSSEADLLLSSSMLYEAGAGLGALSTAGGLQDLLANRSVGMQSQILAANDTGAAEQTVVQTLQVDVLRQAVAGFGETGFVAMTGSSVLPDEDNAMLSVKQRSVLNSAGIGRI